MVGGIIASQILTSKKFWIWLGVIVAIGLIFWFGYREAKKGKYIKVGGDSFDGYNPNLDAMALYDELGPWTWTSVDKVISVLANKTDSQIALIFNAYSSIYNKDLLEDINSEFSGDDLTQVLSYFNGVDLN